jgi:uncharacterized membrane protein YfcA
MRLGSHRHQHAGGARSNPRFTIGSVNFSEFFITFSQSVVFVFTLQFSEYWKVILGLLIGGAVAAPMAAVVTKRLPVRPLMHSILIILLSVCFISGAGGDRKFYPV